MAGCGIHTPPLTEPAGRVVPGSIAERRDVPLGDVPQRRWFRGVDRPAPPPILRRALTPIGPPTHDVDAMLTSRRRVERFGGSFRAPPPEGSPERFVERVQAPWRHLVSFEGSAHHVPFEEPEAFTRTIVDALFAAARLRQQRQTGPGRQASPGGHPARAPAATRFPTATQRRRSRLSAA